MGLKGRGHTLGETTASGSITFNLSTEPKLKRGEENVVEVVVFNQEQHHCIPYRDHFLCCPGTKDDGRSDFYALAIGTSDYKEKIWT